MQPTNSPAPVDDPSLESTFWFIQRDDKPVGPIFFSRLRQMAHQQKLSADDLIRKGKTGEWIRAATLSELAFTEIKNSTSSSNVAPTTAVVQTAAARPRTSLFSLIYDRLDNFWYELRLFVGDRFGSLRKLTSWLALVMIAGYLLITLLNSLSIDWWTFASPTAEYKSILEEFKKLRSSKASTERWDEFSTRALRRIAPLIDRFEKSASSNNRFAQQMLWAGRDYLPLMLKDARTDVSPSEQKFLAHLQRANWLAQGKELNGKFAHPNSSFLLTYVFGDSVLIPAILVVDGVILIGLAYWWLGRKKPADKSTDP